MESIFKFCLLFLLLILIYYWFLHYNVNNHYAKKIYIPSSYISSSTSGKGSASGSASGSGKGDGTKSDPYCENNPNPCQNDGKCINDDEYGYTCNCPTISGVDSSGKKFSGKSFSGINCEFEDDTAKGVRVEIDEIVPLVEYDRVALFNTDDIQWNDYL